MCGFPKPQHGFTVQVDAALDLSHTQNIGRMIKTHFPYSQFIVVSLKEGMFSNANVIFRTKFVDGVSAVTRSVNSSKCVSAPACPTPLWEVTAACKGGCVQDLHCHLPASTAVFLYQVCGRHVGRHPRSANSFVSITDARSGWNNTC